MRAHAPQQTTGRSCIHLLQEARAVHSRLSSEDVKSMPLIDIEHGLRALSRGHYFGDRHDTRYPFAPREPRARTGCRLERMRCPAAVAARTRPGPWPRRSATPGATALVVGAVMTLPPIGVQNAPPNQDDGDAPYPPPSQPAESAGVAPVVGWFWISGFWAWQAGRHVWIQVRWEAPRPGWGWTPHRWAPAGRGWRSMPGHWARR